MSSQGRFTIKAYCLCGASMKGSGAGDLSAAKELEDVFWSVHQGDSHGPTDTKGAAAARRKAERETLRSFQ